MSTSLDLDDELVTAAKELGGHKTKRAAANAALEEYVRQRRLENFFALCGTIDYWDDYDYKELRRRDSRGLVEADADAD